MCSPARMVILPAHRLTNPAPRSPRNSVDSNREKTQVIWAEVNKLLARGIIRPSKFPSDMQVLCVRKMYKSLRLCVDWRRLTSPLVPDTGGLGDIQAILAGLRGKLFFTQLDLANGFHQVLIVEKDKCKTAFRDADGSLYKFSRAGFLLIVLSHTFMMILKRALGTGYPYVVS